MREAFGPLNGVRVGLVSVAVVAAMLATALGQWIVAAVLGAGIAVHGLGWWYLYRNHHRTG